MEGESLDGFTTNPNNPDVMVSLFEYSIENHFRAMDTISKLCGEKEEKEASYASDERFSSTITFLREWKHYCYKPKTVRFTYEVEDPQGKDVLNALDLPQFSAASVPKLGSLSSEQNYLKASKDSVMYVGGSVWALDWCPSIHQRSDSPIKCEYLAVAAHPPESSYHKIGAPLTGRGVVQIWCLLNANLKEEDLPPLKKPERRGRPRKNTVAEESGDLDKGREGISPPPKKARGRPRKKTEESIGDLDRNTQFDHALVVHLDKEMEKISPPLKKARGRPRKKAVIEECIGDLDDDGQSVQAHSVQLDKGTKKISLPLEKARGGLRKKTVTEECIGDSDTTDQLAQAPPVQLDRGTEKLEKARERSRKKTLIEESIGELDGNGQFVEALVVQLDKTIEEISPPSNKARGRPRKKKGAKGSLHDLDIDGQIVPALAVEFPEDQAGIPSKTGPVKNDHEQEVLKSPDVELERETQQGFSDAEVACKSGHNILRSERKVEDKAKAVICHEVLQSPDTDVELGRETQQDFSGTELACKSGHNIPRLKRKAKDRARAWIEQLKIHDDGEVEREKQPCLSGTEVAYKSGKYIPQPKRKMKNKPRAGIYHDDIHPHFQSTHAEKESPIAVVQAAKSCEQDPMPSSPTSLNGRSLDTNTPNFHLPQEVALPRVVLCLAHNGKVAWDVKWRPSSINDLEDKHCMGYLAVLLGNGSLEVWEVPFPGTLKVLYSSHKRENTDPRFVKLAPVFRCSKLKCGDRQSIPLTLEWSTSAPHDLILAGCHDGTVALWKFSPSGSSQVADTRPLLYFTADTVPIRALAWAPGESDAESANVIVTAGHGGVRFWDLRDPYHPLWELNPGRRGVYSLDWLPDPRCIIMSFDDGTLRFLSMSNSANDVPVTGKPFDGTQQQGLHSYFCSSFPIWSIQASKLTGLVAYSTADGSVLRFQLTSKAVDKDPSRNRTPHFLCASLTAEEDATIEINTPLPNIPYPMKKSLNEWGDTPRSMHRFLSQSNQAKRANDQTTDEPNLLAALCYGDDPLLAGSGDTTPLAMQKTKSTSKPKIPQKKTPTLDMVCSYGEETQNLQREEHHKDEKRKEIEAFPSKLVAMHRVRWNMNKGSERWLCYGGAAGIVRCQEFTARTIEECALIKR